MRSIISLIALGAMLSGTCYAAEKEEHGPHPGGPDRAEMEKTVADVFAAADADGNKSLSPSECDAAMKALHEKMMAAHGQKEGHKEGHKEEGKDGQKEGHKDGDKEGDRAGERAKAFTAADADHDGVLSLAEFKELVQHKGGQRPPAHDHKEK